MNQSLLQFSRARQSCARRQIGPGDCYTAGMQAEPGFTPHMRRKRLRSYEFELARRAYAYGVDLRRTRWLTGSSVGSALVRSVDRRWPDLVSTWESQHLSPANAALPPALLDELDRLVSLLRCVRPIVRMVRDETAWPLATPLAPAHGSDPWLFIAPGGLLALPRNERAFMLGAALGHLQCDHGALFAAHWMLAHGGHSLRASVIKTALRPWTALQVFSSDRAGLLACLDLEAANFGLQRTADEVDRFSWLPRIASIADRRFALADFRRSLTMARIEMAARAGAVANGLLEAIDFEVLAAQAKRERDGSPEKERESVDSLVRDASKAPSNGHAEHQHRRVAGADTDASSAGSSAGSASNDSTSTSTADANVAEPENDDADRDNEPIDAENDTMGVASDSWSLARCDRRLTERLRLF